jgi:hypothetical protein
MFPDFLLATLARLIAGCLPQPLTVRRLGQAPRLATYCHRTKKKLVKPPGKKFLGTLCHPACGVVHCTTLWSATWLTCEKTSRNQKSCTVQRYGVQRRMSVFL